MLICGCICVVADTDVDACHTIEMAANKNIYRHRHVHVSKHAHIRPQEHSYAADTELIPPAALQMLLRLLRKGSAKFRGKARSPHPTVRSGCSRETEEPLCAPMQILHHYVSELQHTPANPSSTC